MRSFIAVELDADVREALDKLQRRLREACPLPVTWVKPQAMHVTLRFLGDITPVQARAIQNRLAAGLQGAGLPQTFAVHLQGTGAFPSLKRPSVLWAGVQLHPHLAKLAQTVESCVVACGLPPESRPFSPHITLGRVKNPRREDAFAQKLVEIGAHFQAILPVRHCTLFESRLTPHGPVYQPLAHFPLPLTPLP